MIWQSLGNDVITLRSLYPFTFVVPQAMNSQKAGQILLS